VNLAGILGRTLPPETSRVRETFYVPEKDLVGASLATALTNIAAQKCRSQKQKVTKHVTMLAPTCFLAMQLAEEILFVHDQASTTDPSAIVLMRTAVRLKSRN